MADDGPDLVLAPMVLVDDLAGTLAVFEQVLGARVQAGSADGDWIQLRVGGAQVGLLAHPPNPQQNEGAVELNFRRRAHWNSSNGRRSPPASTSQPRS